jgi:hypothetical protein
MPRPRRKLPDATQLAPHVEPINVGDQAAPSVIPAPAHPRPERRHRAGSEDLPLYRKLVRTEGRFRPDQVDALNQLARHVMANRQTPAERITANTLVRLAVDLLLAHADKLSGDTEDQLRESLIPESGTQ